MTSDVKIIKPKEEYQRRLTRALDYATKIVIPQEDYDTIMDFSKEWAEEKRKAKMHYEADGRYLDIRSLNGHLGQIALEHFLGKRFTDLDPKFGFEKNTHDLGPIGLKYGVKTHRVANPPMIDVVGEDKRYPQIILTRDQTCPRTFYLLGLFPVSLLYHEDFSDAGLIYDDELRKRQAKIPFFGVDLGKPFHTYDDLLTHAGIKWSLN
jgi:hypothetical protein